MTEPRRTKSKADLSLLTDREREVLRLIADGLSVSEISRVLFRSEKTIQSHRLSIGRKLGARNRVELARIAIEAGLTSASNPAEGAEGDEAADLPVHVAARLPEGADGAAPAGAPREAGITRMVMYGWDLERGVRVFSPALAALLGRERPMLGDGVTDWLVFVHADDRQRVRQALQDVIDGAAGLEVKYRLMRDHQEPMWVREAGQRLEPADGPALVVGFLCPVK